MEKIYKPIFIFSISIKFIAHFSDIYYIKDQKELYQMLIMVVLGTSLAVQ